MISSDFTHSDEHSKQDDHQQSTRLEISEQPSQPIALAPTLLAGSSTMSVTDPLLRSGPSAPIPTYSSALSVNAENGFNGIGGGSGGSSRSHPITNRPAVNAAIAAENGGAKTASSMGDLENGGAAHLLSNEERARKRSESRSRLGGRHPSSLSPEEWQYDLLPPRMPMSGFKLFGKAFYFGAEDMFFPALCAIVFDVAILGVAVASRILYSESAIRAAASAPSPTSTTSNCTAADSDVLNAYTVLQLVQWTAFCCLDVGVIVSALSSNMFKKNKSIVAVMYLRILFTLLLAVVTALCTYWTVQLDNACFYAPSGNVAALSKLLLTLLVCSWLVCISGLLFISCSFWLASGIGRFTDQDAWVKKLQRFFCCGSDAASSDVYSSIAEAFTEFFRNDMGIHLVPSDVAVGLMLVQGAQRQAFKAGHQFFVADTADRWEAHRMKKRREASQMLLPSLLNTNNNNNSSSSSSSCCTATTAAGAAANVTPMSTSTSTSTSTSPSMSRAVPPSAASCVSQGASGSVGAAGGAGDVAHSKVNIDRIESKEEEQVHCLHRLSSMGQVEIDHINLDEEDEDDSDDDDEGDNRDDNKAHGSGQGMHGGDDGGETDTADESAETMGMLHASSANIANINTSANSGGGSGANAGGVSGSGSNKTSFSQGGRLKLATSSSESGGDGGGGGGGVGLGCGERDALASSDIELGLGLGAIAGTSSLAPTYSNLEQKREQPLSSAATPTPTTTKGASVAAGNRESVGKSTASSGTRPRTPSKNRRSLSRTASAAAAAAAGAGRGSQRGRFDFTREDAVRAGHEQWMVDEVLAGRQPALPVEDWARIKQAKYFAKFAQGAYGWPLYLFEHTCSAIGGCVVCAGGCGHASGQPLPDGTPGHPGSCCTCGHAYPRGVLQNSGCCGAVCGNSSAKVFLAHTGLNPADILYANLESRYGTVTYYVCKDEASKKLVVAVRGTLSIGDTLTDLDAQVTFLPCAPQYYAHKGIAACAEWLYKELTGQGPFDVNNWLKHHKQEGYSLLICGHSLGAGVAAILSVYMVRQHPDVQAISYAPPLCMDPRLAHKMRPAITSIVYKHDIISRLSLPNLFRLKKQMSNAFKVCASSKFSIMRAGFRKAHDAMFDPSIQPGHWRLGEARSIVYVDGRPVEQLPSHHDGTIGSTSAAAAAAGAIGPFLGSGAVDGNRSADGNGNGNGNGIGVVAAAGGGLQAHASAASFRAGAHAALTVLAQGDPEDMASIFATGHAFFEAQERHDQVHYEQQFPRGLLDASRRGNHHTGVSRTQLPARAPAAPGAVGDGDGDGEEAISRLPSQLTSRVVPVIGPVGARGPEGESVVSLDLLSTLPSSQGYVAHGDVTSSDPRVERAAAHAVGEDQLGMTRTTTMVVPVTETKTSTTTTTRVSATATSAGTAALQTSASTATTEQKRQIEILIKDDSAFLTVVPGRIYHLLPRRDPDRHTRERSCVDKACSCVASCLCLHCCTKEDKKTLVYPAHARMFEEIYVSSSMFTDHLPAKTFMTDVDIPEEL